MSQHFTSTKGIHEWVRTVYGLSATQREAVEEVLVSHLKGGEVSRDAFLYKIPKELRALKAEGVLGSGSYEKVMEDLDERYNAKE